MEQEGNGVNPNPNPANQPENQPPAPAAGNLIPPNSPPPHLNCARCDSSNTKFCYFNNYSRAQPRYFCRSCRRYWTHGGTLRNLPNGVGARRVRRPLRVRQAPAAAAAGQGCRALMLPPEPHQQMPEPHQQMMGPAFYGGGSFLQPFPAGQLTGNIGLLQAITLQSLKSPAAGNLVAQQNLIAQPIRAWAPNGNASGSGSNGAGPSFIDEAGPSFSDDPDQWLEDDRQG